MGGGGKPPKTHSGSGGSGSGGEIHIHNYPQDSAKQMRAIARMVKTVLAQLQRMVAPLAPQVPPVQAQAIPPVQPAVPPPQAVDPIAAADQALGLAERVRQQMAAAAPAHDAGQGNVVVPIAAPEARLETAPERRAKGLAVLFGIGLAALAAWAITWGVMKDSEPTTPPPPVATATEPAPAEEDTRPHCAIVRVTGACAEDLASPECIADLGNCQE